MSGRSSEPPSRAGCATASRLTASGTSGRPPTRGAPRADVDLDEPDFLASCRQRPLGAYYRVNAYRLDDMQSAISELHAIAVSAAIHDGWSKPKFVANRARAVRRHRPCRGAEPKGGHAFVLVGYNEIGFLVQNSWGVDWGDHGFAILTYEDWLLSAYDAWVARPASPTRPSPVPRRHRPGRRPARWSSTAGRTSSCCATSW